MVEVFKCPTVAPPRSGGDRKRERGDMGWDSKPSSSFSRDNYSRERFSSEKKQKREELSSIHASIKNLSATSYTGMNRIKHKEDKLTKLGAPPPKEQKMPFKMKMGILEGRKRRELKTEERAKESGVVHGKKASLPHGSSSDKKRRGKREDFEGHGGFDVKTKGGVFHLSKHRLPKRLLSSGSS